MAILEFHDVAYKDGGTTILNGLNVEIEAGDFVSIVGPSGSGKSTFLKLCCHLLSPSSGAVRYKDKDVLAWSPVELRQQVAYCFQTPYLFGDTVRENLYFPYSLRGLKPDTERITTLFRAIEMSEDYLGHDVATLSGGERQRIALIRSLLFQPEILLLDEVTAALDAASTAVVERLIAEFHKAGVTILWITHNLEQSRKYANKLLTIEAGQAKAMEVLQ